MRILVTGAGGFVGQWVCQNFSEAGHHVIATDLAETTKVSIELDVTQPDSIRTLLKEQTPDACLHLGGIAFVPLGWENPSLVYQVNTLGTLNLLEACRETAPDARFLMVSSAEVYGRDSRPTPIQEEDGLHPSNIYAISKAAADQTVLLYAKRYGMHTMTARPQNHIGPGQSERFVAASFAQQVADIASGKAPNQMNVGNLDAVRDFLDVRDVADGYRLILENGHAGEAYNLASGSASPIRTLLDTLCELAGCQPNIQIDPSRYREEVDPPPLLNTDKIRAQTGWSPSHSLRDTLSDILESL